MDKKLLTSKIKELLEKNQEKGFKQSVEVCINFKDINIEDASSKLNLNVFLPKGRGKDINIGVFADGDMNLRAKKLSDFVMSKQEIDANAKDKRKMRRFADDCYFFIAQADLMAHIGKTLGVVLAPRSKMPQPIPPTVDLKPLFDRLKNTVRIKSRKNPTVQAPIGVEDMSPEDLTENAVTVLNAIEKQIPEDKFRSVYIKTTMGGMVRVL